MAPDVSICVATCRRPAGLARLLASLRALTRPAGCELEVVVVDNDPARSAAPVLSDAGCVPGLRALWEPRRNIARARNRGVEAARGRWLAFVDDDEVVEPGWLAAYWEQACADSADGWFGPVIPALEPGGSSWLPESFHARPRFATGAPLGVAQLSTSNAWLRASLFEWRRFDPELGLRGGSDTELFGRMLREGARFRWCDEARVSESIPAARHRLGWLAQRAFRGGFVHTRLEQREVGRARAAWRGLPRAVAALGATALALPVAALGGRTPAARVWLRGCTQVGHLWAFLEGDYEEYGSA